MIALKWVVAGVLFMDGLAINSKIFALDPEEYRTEAECEKWRGEMVDQAAKGGHQVWAKCLLVETPKPPPKKPSDKKSEVTS